MWSKMLYMGEMIQREGILSSVQNRFPFTTDLFIGLALIPLYYSIGRNAQQELSIRFLRQYVPLFASIAAFYYCYCWLPTEKVPAGKLRNIEIRITTQWRIQDFPLRGAILIGGAPTSNLPTLSKWKNLDPWRRGRRLRPLESANATELSIFCKFSQLDFSMAWQFSGEKWPVNFTTSKME